MRCWYDCPCALHELWGFPPLTRPGWAGRARRETPHNRGGRVGIQTPIFRLKAFLLFVFTDENVLMGAPTGSGKTVTAELTMLRLFRCHPGDKVRMPCPLLRPPTGLPLDAPTAPDHPATRWRERG